MFDTGRKAGAGVMIVAMMVLGMFAIPSAASAGPVVLTDQLETETGGTEILGGGDHFFVKFGTDAAFGVVWGNETNENNVYMVAIKARYLGVAQVYDRDGNVVEEDRLIKVYTMYAVKLDTLLEFGDLNDNGVLQYHRVYAMGNFTGDYVGQEPIYKMVDLKTSWTQSEVEYAEADDSRSWSFDLTATDMPYVPLDNYTGAVGDDMLNALELSFHLEANMVQMDNATLPQFRITVTRGPLGVMWYYGAERMEDFQVAGKVVKYGVKWDQRIEGWDFDAANTVNPSLLLEFGALVGHWMPQTRAAWMEMRVIRAVNEYGYMAANEGTASEFRLNETAGVLSQVRTLTQNRLMFQGEWDRIGAMHWVTDVQVDGISEQLHAQIMAGIPVWTVGPNRAVFAGFAVLGGMAFPGGGLIVHDPTFEADALVDVSTQSEPRIPVLLLLVAAAVAVVIVAVVAATMLSGKKPGQKVQHRYEKTYSSQPGEWSKYYNKK